jgi:hypothetical protein
MAEVLGAWEGVERQIGAIRRRLMDKPGMDSNLLAQIRARLEGVLATLVADGRVWVERPGVVVDLFAGGDRSACGVALGRPPFEATSSPAAIARGTKRARPFLCSPTQSQSRSCRCTARPACFGSSRHDPHRNQPSRLRPDRQRRSRAVCLLRTRRTRRASASSGWTGGCRSSEGHAWSGGELQRRHIAACG